MKSLIAIGLAALLAAASVHAQDVPDRSGAHGFDFEFGNWRVHHHVKRAADGKWIDYNGTSSDRPLMDGSANVEDNTFFRPTGNTQGVALRAYDRKTGLWAIWWVDSRAPHLSLDPPV